MKRFLKVFQSLPKRNQRLVVAVVLIPALMGVLKIVVAMRQQVRFVSARQVVDPVFLDSVIRENYAGSTRLNPYVVRRDGFLIFDFRSQELCGVAGCLYSAYVMDADPSARLRRDPSASSGRRRSARSSGRRLLALSDAEVGRSNGDHISFYLKGIPTACAERCRSVRLFDFERQGTAKCFVTSQRPPESEGIIATRYCYQQGKLAKVITELKKNSHLE